MPTSGALTAPTAPAAASGLPASAIPVLIANRHRASRRVLADRVGAQGDFRVIGEVRSGAEAIKAIDAERPAVVFLDLALPDGGGGDVVRAVGVGRMPAMVLTAAHPEHALEAFEVRALDFLLEPLDPARIDAALGRVREQLRRHALEDRLLSFLERQESVGRYTQRIAVRRGTRTTFIPLSVVDSLEAEENYVRIRAGQQSYLVRDTLSRLASQLDPSRFLRIHRSLVVQLARVTEVESLPAGEFVLLLANGRRLTSGRGYRRTIQGAFGL